MQELPEDLLTTDKLLYLTGLDGESQVALMRKLAEVAQELYEKNWFCALIPFGSRTRGLNREETSDIDILVIISNTRKKGIANIIQEKLEEKGVAHQVSVYSMKKSRYIECLTSTNGTEVECNAVAGIILGPTKLKGAREQMRKQTTELKRKVTKHILHNILMASSFRRQSNSIWSNEPTFKEPAEKRIGDSEKNALYIKNRLRLWERRIRILLDLKEQKKD